MRPGNVDRPPADQRTISLPGGSRAEIWKWPVIVFATGLLLTAALAWLAAWGGHVRDAGRFDNAVQRTSTSIEAKLEAYIGLLRAGAGYFAGSHSVTREEFRAVANRIQLDKFYPGVQGIGYAQRVAPSERTAFVAAQREGGRPTFDISPAGDREDFFPIVFLEPEDRRNVHAIGYDMFSEPIRREAMVRARDRGIAAASSRVVLVQEIDAKKQAGFLIYVPVYRGGSVPTTVAERRTALEGFVYSPFRAEDLLAGLMRGERMPRVNYEIYDGHEPASEQLLHRSPHAPSKRPAFDRVVQLQIADHTWTVRYRTTDAFDKDSRGATAWVAIGGILVSGMLGWITLALARAEARARARGREIEENREHLRVTLASIGDAVISTDAHGGVTFMNPVAEQLTGWHLSEASGRPLAEVFKVIDEQTGRPVPSPAEAVLREGTSMALANHTVLISKAGDSIPIDDSAAPIRSAGGEMLGVVLVFHDVTGQRRASEALRASEARKDAILRSALDAIITINHEGLLVEFNPAAERIFGYSRDAVLGRQLSELIIPTRYRERHHRGMSHYLATGEGPALRRQLEMPAMRADGTEFPAELAIIPIPNTEPPMFTAFLRDITERKRIEQQLREAAERFRFMAESIPQKIFTARPGGEFDYFNQQWMQFTGLDLAALQRSGWACFVHEDDLAENIHLWEEAVAKGDPFQIEHRIRRHDGVYRWHLTRALAFRDAGGGVQIWIGSNTDIDDQKREEDRLEKTVAERTTALRETNEQLESFVYTIAHDLRGPLRAIAGYSQLLADDYASALDETARHLLQRVQGSAEFMDRLILDLLAFGRTSRAEIELGPVDVHKAWSIALAQTAGQREQTQADIATVGASYLVLAHEPTLGQVFTNLVSNAMKFVAPGVRPQIRLRSEERGDIVRLWVEDNGIGIPPEMRERVFRVFERLNGSRYSGTGIGLSIVRKGVERMGGRVEVDSTPGQGSRFWIDLKKAAP
jgi:PAS domain S-box-containing protein